MMYQGGHSRKGLPLKQGSIDAAVQTRRVSASRKETRSYDALSLSGWSAKLNTPCSHLRVYSVGMARRKDNSSLALTEKLCG